MSRLEFLDELARRELDMVKIDFDQLRKEIGAAWRRSALESWCVPKWAVLW